MVRFCVKTKMNITNKFSKKNNGFIMYTVSHIPIRKNNKTYRVGDKFPYTENDSKLLWNLENVEEKKSPTKTNKTNNNKQ